MVGAAVPRVESEEKMRLGEAREILNVHGYSYEDARKIYRRAALAEHPDKSGHANSTERFQRVQDAWTCCQAAQEAGAWSDDEFGDEREDEFDEEDEDIMMDVLGQMFFAQMFGGRGAPPGRPPPRGFAGGFPGGFPGGVPVNLPSGFAAGFAGGFPGGFQGGCASNSCNCEECKWERRQEARAAC